jgi:hypothetical protein
MLKNVFHKYHTSVITPKRDTPSVTTIFAHIPNQMYDVEFANPNHGIYESHEFNTPASYKIIKDEDVPQIEFLQKKKKF